MLVLTRKVGEDIIIEGNGRTVIRLVHISTDGAQVKLGFDAPKDIVINRAEVAMGFSPKPRHVRRPLASVLEVSALAAANPAGLSAPSAA